MSAKAIANIAHSITSADVPALSFARNRDPEPWGNLLSDLELWHVARYVFEGAKIAWTSPEAAADGIIVVNTDGSVEISRGGKKTSLQAEQGCEFHDAAQTHDGDNCIVTLPDEVKKETEAGWEAGAVVRVVGLTKALHHNGKIGRVSSKAGPDGRIGKV